MEIKSRICTKCKLEKLLSEFNNDKKGKYGKRSLCKKCESQKRKKYYQKYAEERKAYRKQYYQENKETENRQSEKYRKSHLEKFREYDKKYRNKPAKKKMAQERKRKWYHTPRGRQLEKARKYRRRLQIKATQQPYDFEKICDKYGNICLRCKKKRKLTVDHVIPLSKGGHDTEQNVQPLCKHCNCIKRDKLGKEWDFRTI